MADAASGLSPRILEALTACAHFEPATVHRLQVGLAGLVSEQASPSASQHLALATAFIEGRARREELKEAQQDCWTYVGSLACGCSVADSASAHAILICLETAADAHAALALREQVERVLRCAVAETSVLAILEGG
jgi:hypothetical protein